jgi:hypothetical protein
MPTLFSAACGPTAVLEYELKTDWPQTLTLLYTESIKLRHLDIPFPILSTVAYHCSERRILAASGSLHRRWVTSNLGHLTRPSYTGHIVTNPTKQNIPSEADSSTVSQAISYT